MIMDMQIGVFCGVFSIIASLAVYAILSFYSIKEDSFDEAKANRRKLFKEYLDQRGNTEKPKQKKVKKVTKKPKEKKTEQTTDHVLKTDEKKDAATTVVSKEVSSVPLKDSTEQPKKAESTLKSGSKAKFQHVEKDDITSSNSAQVNANENPSKKVPEKKNKPKSQEKKAEVEPVQQAGGAIPKETEKKVKAEAKTEKKKVENPIVPSTSKKQSSGADKQVINVNSILSLIVKAQLSRSDVQLLIDSLLNSEDETSDWLKVKKLDSGRQDNCVKLRKQLSELELTMKNEKQITLSLQSKLKELRTELAVDKNAATTLKETVNKMQQEKDDILYEKSELSYKLKAALEEKQEVQEQLNKELAKAQEQQKLDEDRQQESLVALKDELNGMTAQLEGFENENVSLKATISCLEGELNMHQNCNEKINGLERALNVLSEKLSEEEKEVSITRKQMESVSSTLNKFKKDNNDLKADNDCLNDKLAVSNKDLERLKEEVYILSEKLSNFENEENGQENGDGTNGFDSENYQKVLEEKDNSLKQMTKQIDNYMKSLDDYKHEMLKINEENEKLKSMLDRANSELVESKANILKLNSQKSEGDHMLSNLRNNLNDSNNEINFLKDEIEKYKQTIALKENEIDEKVSGGSDTNGIDAKYDSLKLVLEEKDHHVKQMEKQINNDMKTLNDLRQELNNANNENDNLKSLLDQANSEIAELKKNIAVINHHNSECEELIEGFKKNLNISNSEINSLKEEIEKYKQRNNELRNKNWKVVQALTDAEKALQNKLRLEQHEGNNNHKNVEELQSNVNTFVRRVFPDIDIEEYKGHFNDWLRSVEDAVSISKTKNCPQDLQSQNTHLQSLVVTYKKIISDTEHMLNELQNHIEVEEMKWKEKFASYQKEIESLRASQRSSS